MRALWVHNFPHHIVSSGVFMYRLADEVRRTGVEVDLFDTGSLRGVRRLLAAQRAVARAARGYDVVHAQFGSASALVASAAPGRKVLSLRGTDLLGCDTGSLLYRLHGRAARWMTRRALPAYERVIVMSHRMRDELRMHHGRAAGVDVVPDGVDLDRFRPLDRQAARAALGYAGDDRPWVLFGSLRQRNPIKRPELAAAAVERAAALRPGIVLRTMTGRPHDEAPLWMNAAHVLLMTSTREGWPNVVKEALACNVPFVATEVSDLARIAAVEPACVVAEAEPEALARGLLAALDAPATGSLRRHVEPMAIGAIAEQLWRIYADLCSARKAAA
jgi:glycosyltransferase involved in cell wall biosynthesis